MTNFRFAQRCMYILDVGVQMIYPPPPPVAVSTLPLSLLKYSNTYKYLYFKIIFLVTVLNIWFKFGKLGDCLMAKHLISTRSV